MGKLTLTSPSGTVDIDYNIALSGFSKDETHDFRLEFDQNELLKYSEESESMVLNDSLTYENNVQYVIPGFKQNDELVDLVLPTGLIAIYGNTNSGKTELAKRLAVRSGGEFIRFHEPELPSLTSHIKLFTRLEEFLESDKQILVWDSMRKYIYSTSDDVRRPAGKGGINPSLYNELTSLSILASLAGKTILVVVNPMTDKEDDVKTIAHAIEGSITGIIKSRKFGSFSLTARGVNHERIDQQFTYDGPVDDFARQENVNNESDLENMFKVETKEDDSNVSMAATFKRLYK